MNDIRVAELFAGVGGFRLGLEKANSRLGRNREENLCLPERQEAVNGTGDFDTQIQRPNGRTQHQAYSFSIVWANEWDKYAASIYRKNFGEKELVEGDIRKIKADDIPDHDLLVGGFPCQPFSMAGKRKGFKDIRGTLFFEIVRIAAAKRPKLLFLENVKGLLNHDNGDTFETIVRTLDELGYNVEWKVLNSKYFGVPQNRERVFIIGHLREGSAKQVFPITTHGGLDCAPQRETPKAFQTLEASQCKGVSAERFFAVLTPGRKDKRQNGRRFKDAGEEFFTLTGQDIHGIYDGENLRYITPLECERLQGFPDGWTNGISDTQRYKCLGNAVTVNVIQAIGELILEALD